MKRYEKISKFSIRKFNVGAVSVLIGSLIFGSMLAPSAFAKDTSSDEILKENVPISETVKAENDATIEKTSSIEKNSEVVEKEVVEFKKEELIKLINYFDEQLHEESITENVKLYKVDLEKLFENARTTLQKATSQEEIDEETSLLAGKKVDYENLLSSEKEKLEKLENNDNNKNNNKDKIKENEDKDKGESTPKENKEVKSTPITEEKTPKIENNSEEKIINDDNASLAKKETTITVTPKNETVVKDKKQELVSLGEEVKQSVARVGETVDNEEQTTVEKALKLLEEMQKAYQNVNISAEELDSYVDRLTRMNASIRNIIQRRTSGKRDPRNGSSLGERGSGFRADAKKFGGTDFNSAKVEYVTHEGDGSGLQPNVYLSANFGWRSGFKMEEYAKTVLEFVKLNYTKTNSGYKWHLEFNPSNKTHQHMYYWFTLPKDTKFKKSWSMTFRRADKTGYSKGFDGTLDSDWASVGAPDKKEGKIEAARNSKIGNAIGGYEFGNDIHSLSDFARHNKYTVSVYNPKDFKDNIDEHTYNEGMRVWNAINSVETGPDKVYSFQSGDDTWRPNDANSWFTIEFETENLPEERMMFAAGVRSYEYSTWNNYNMMYYESDDEYIKRLDKNKPVVKYNGEELTEEVTNDTPTITVFQGSKFTMPLAVHDVGTKYTTKTVRSGFVNLKYVDDGGIPPGVWFNSSSDNANIALRASNTHEGENGGDPKEVSLTVAGHKVDENASLGDGVITMRASDSINLNLNSDTDMGDMNVTTVKVKRKILGLVFEDGKVKEAESAGDTLRTKIEMNANTGDANDWLTVSDGKNSTDTLFPTGMNFRYMDSDGTLKKSLSFNKAGEHTVKVLAIFPKDAQGADFDTKVSGQNGEDSVLNGLSYKEKTITFLVTPKAPKITTSLDNKGGTTSNIGATTSPNVSVKLYKEGTLLPIATENSDGNGNVIFHNIGLTNGETYYAIATSDKISSKVSNKVTVNDTEAPIVMLEHPSLSSSEEHLITVDKDENIITIYKGEDANITFKAFDNSGSVEGFTVTGLPTGVSVNATKDKTNASESTPLKATTTGSATTAGESEVTVHIGDGTNIQDYKLKVIVKELKDKESNNPTTTPTTRELGSTPLNDEELKKLVTGYNTSDLDATKGITLTKPANYTTAFNNIGVVNVKATVNYKDGSAEDVTIPITIQDTTAPVVKIGDKVLTETASDTIIDAYRGEDLAINFKVSDNSGNVTIEYVNNNINNNHQGLPDGMYFNRDASATSNEKPSVTEATTDKDITINGKLSVDNTENPASTKDNPTAGYREMIIKATDGTNTVERKFIINVKPQAEAPSNKIVKVGTDTTTIPVNRLYRDMNTGKVTYMDDKTINEKVLVYVRTTHGTFSAPTFPDLTTVTETGKPRKATVTATYQDGSVSDPYEVDINVVDNQNPNIESESTLTLYRGEKVETIVKAFDNSGTETTTGLKETTIKKGLYDVDKVGLKIVESENVEEETIPVRGNESTTHTRTVKKKILTLGGLDNGKVAKNTDLGAGNLLVTAVDNSNNRGSRAINYVVRAQKDKYTPTVNKDTIFVPGTLRDEDVTKLLGKVSVDDLSKEAIADGGFKKTLVNSGEIFDGTEGNVGKKVVKVQVEYPDGSTDVVEVPVRVDTEKPIIRTEGALVTPLVRTEELPSAIIITATDKGPSGIKEITVTGLPDFLTYDKEKGRVVLKDPNSTTVPKDAEVDENGKKVYTVTITAIDNVGNKAEKTRIITVATQAAVYNPGRGASRYIPVKRLKEDGNTLTDDEMKEEIINAVKEYERDPKETYEKIKDKIQSLELVSNISDINTEHIRGDQKATVRVVYNDGSTNNTEVAIIVSDRQRPVLLEKENERHFVAYRGESFTATLHAKDNSRIIRKTSWYTDENSKWLSKWLKVSSPDVSEEEYTGDSVRIMLSGAVPLDAKLGTTTSYVYVKDLSGNQNTRIIVSPDRPKDADLAGVTIIIKEQAEKYTPIGKDQNVDSGVTPKAEDSIANRSELPKDATYTWKDTPVVEGVVNATVIVTYPDKSTDEVIVTLRSNIIPGGSGETPAEGYVRVTFTTEEEKGTLAGGTTVDVLATANKTFADLTKPTVAAKTGYSFTGKWTAGNEAANDGDLINSTRNYEAIFEKYPDVIPADSGKEKPAGYVTVKVSAGEHGTLPAGLKGTYYVNPEVKATVKDVVGDKEATPNTGYKFKAWDKEGTEVVSEDTTITATYNTLANVIPQGEGEGEAKEKPAGYVTVTVSAGEHGTLPAGLKGTYYVNPEVKATVKDVVVDKEATPNTGYKFKAWDKEGTEVVDKDTTIEAVYNFDLSVSTNEVTLLNPSITESTNATSTTTTEVLVTDEQDIKNILDSVVITGGSEDAVKLVKKELVSNKVVDIPGSKWGGNTTVVKVKVSYPDGKDEIVDVKVHIVEKTEPATAIRPTVTVAPSKVALVQKQGGDVDVTPFDENGNKYPTGSVVYININGNVAAVEVGENGQGSLKNKDLPDAILETTAGIEYTPKGESTSLTTTPIAVIVPARVISQNGEVTTAEELPEFPVDQVPAYHEVGEGAVAEELPEFPIDQVPPYHEVGEGAVAEELPEFPVDQVPPYHEVGEGAVAEELPEFPVDQVPPYHEVGEGVVAEELPEFPVDQVPPYHEVGEVATAEELPEFPVDQVPPYHEVGEGAVAEELPEFPVDQVPPYHEVGNPWTEPELPEGRVPETLSQNLQEITSRGKTTELTNNKVNNKENEQLPNTSAQSSQLGLLGVTLLGVVGLRRKKENTEE